MEIVTDDWNHLLANVFERDLVQQSVRLGLRREVKTATRGQDVPIQVDRLNDAGVNQRLIVPFEFVELSAQDRDARFEIRFHNPTVIPGVQDAVLPINRTVKPKPDHMEGLLTDSEIPIEARLVNREAEVILQVDGAVLVHDSDIGTIGPDQDRQAMLGEPLRDRIQGIGMHPGMPVVGEGNGGKPGGVRRNRFQGVVVDVPFNGEVERPAVG